MKASLKRAFCPGAPTPAHNRGFAPSPRKSPGQAGQAVAEVRETPACPGERSGFGDPDYLSGQFLVPFLLY